MGLLRVLVFDTFSDSPMFCYFHLSFLFMQISLRPCCIRAFYISSVFLPYKACSLDAPCPASLHYRFPQNRSCSIPPFPVSPNSSALVLYWVFHFRSPFIPLGWGRVRFLGRLRSSCSSFTCVFVEIDSFIIIFESIQLLILSPLTLLCRRSSLIYPSTDVPPNPFPSLQTRSRPGFCLNK